MHALRRTCIATLTVFMSWTVYAQQTGRPAAEVCLANSRSGRDWCLVQTTTMCLPTIGFEMGLLDSRFRPAFAPSGQLAFDAR